VSRCCGTKRSGLQVKQVVHVQSTDSVKRLGTSSSHAGGSSSEAAAAAAVTDILSHKSGPGPADLVPLTFSQALTSPGPADLVPSSFTFLYALYDGKGDDCKFDSVMYKLWIIECLVQVQYRHTEHHGW
jgi:hypothetical protein